MNSKFLRNWKSDFVLLSPLLIEEKHGHSIASPRFPFSLSGGLITALQAYSFDNNFLSYEIKIEDFLIQSHWSLLFVLFKAISPLNCDE